MKGLKLKSGLFVILAIFLMIPKGTCATSVNDTIFLNAGSMSPIYSISVSRRDIVKWSFQTYNDSFNVYVLAYTYASANHIQVYMDSSGKTSDSGSIRVVTTGNILFYFQNEGWEVDSASGYIDISIRNKGVTIAGYHPLIFLVILISVISIVSLKRKVLLDHQ